jgi:hypothetical protein
VHVCCKSAAGAATTNCSCADDLRLVRVALGLPRIETLNRADPSRAGLIRIVDLQTADPAGCVRTVRIGGALWNEAALVHDELAGNAHRAVGAVCRALARLFGTNVEVVAKAGAGLLLGSAKLIRLASEALATAFIGDRIGGGGCALGCFRQR